MLQSNVKVKVWRQNPENQQERKTVVFTIFGPDRIPVWEFSSSPEFELWKNLIKTCGLWTTPGHLFLN